MHFILFRTLISRLRVLLDPVQSSPETTDSICFHCFLRHRNSTGYCPAGSVDCCDKTGKLKEKEWSQIAQVKEASLLLNNNLAINQFTKSTTLQHLLIQVFSFLSSEAVARRCSIKKVFLKFFAQFTGKHLCRSLFFNKVAGLTKNDILSNDRRVLKIDVRHIVRGYIKFLVSCILL